MTDKEIVRLFLQKNEKAIKILEEQYKNYCIAIGERILESREDAEECWNDVLERTWNAIPPNEPENLKLYVGKIMRNTALKMLDSQRAKKRGGGIKLQLDELAECIPAPFFEQQTDMIFLKDFMNDFVRNLSKEKREIFIRRYWLCESVGEISEKLGCSENKISMILFRIRKHLKKELEKEDFDV